MDKEQKRISRYLCLQAIYASELDINNKQSSIKKINNIKLVLDEMIEDLKSEKKELIKNDSEDLNFDNQLIDLFDNLRTDQIAYSQKLFDLLLDNKDYIDKLIQDRLNNWDMSRLALIDKLILRMSTAEMFFMDDVPPKVSIAEGVEIAKIFSTKDSSSFVNGILDAIYNDEYIKRTTKT